MNLKQQLDYLFNPRSVAVIGASNVFGKLKQSYLDPYPTTEKAATMLAHLVRYSEYLSVAKEK